MPSVAGVQDMIARWGSPVQISRVVTGQAPVTVEAMALVRGYAAEELVGTIQQGDRRIVMGDAEIAAGEWPGPPVRGDRVLLPAVDGTTDLTCTVQAVEVVLLAGVVCKYVLRVRG